MPPHVSSTAYQLLVAVLEHSPLFRQGFEAGMLWGHLQRKAPVITATVHRDNQPVLEAMAEVQGYVSDFLPGQVDGWLVVRFVYVDGEEEG